MIVVRTPLIMLAERLERSDGDEPMCELWRDVAQTLGVPFRDGFQAAEGSLDACERIHRAVLADRWAWTVETIDPDYDDRGVARGWAVLKPKTEHCAHCGASKSRWLSPQDAPAGRPATPALAWLAMICRAVARERADGKAGE